MTIPNLPTDNLYKFKFLGGLTLIIASCYIFLIQYNNLSDKIAALKISISEIKTESTFIKQDSLFIQKEIVRLKKELNVNDTSNNDNNHKDLMIKLEKDRNFREYYSFVLSHNEELLPKLKDIEKLRAIITKNDSLNRKSIYNLNLISTKTDIVEKEYYHLLLLSILCIGLVYAGIKMTSNGHDKWLNLVQKPTDEKILLELKQLKEKINKKSN